MSEMKVSQGSLMKKKRKITPYDDSWIDSFDSRLMKGRKDITLKEKIDFAKKLREIDPCSGILDFSPFSPNYDENESYSFHFDNNISHRTILSQDKNYVGTNFNNLSEDNLLNFAEEFLKALTFSDNDRMTINKATMGQHRNESWHEMRHLLVTGKKIKSLYTRQKTLEKDPHIDVSLTVKNFTEEKEFKESQVYPEAVEHGIKEEENAKFYYSKLNEKKHCSFYLEEPGLLISSSYTWIGASLDGIRKCQGCEPTVVEIKCPFKGKDLDPKIAFLLPTISGK